MIITFMVTYTVGLLAAVSIILFNEDYRFSKTLSKFNFGISTGFTSLFYIVILLGPLSTVIMTMIIIFDLIRKYLFS
jgi:hypothetical protein